MTERDWKDEVWEAFEAAPPHEVRPNWIVDADGKVRDALTGEPVDNMVTLEGMVVAPDPAAANRSQENPDEDPRYIARRAEAMRRYPLEDERPGKDRHSVTRQAFIDGAEWEAEDGRAGP